MLVKQETGEVLSMSPMYVWLQTSQKDAWLNCLVFDGGAPGSLSFKTIGSASSLTLEAPEYDELRAMAEEVIDDRCVATRYDGCKFIDAEGVVE